MLLQLDYLSASDLEDITKTVVCGGLEVVTNKATDIVKCLRVRLILRNLENLRGSLNMVASLYSLHQST